MVTPLHHTGPADEHALAARALYPLFPGARPADIDRYWPAVLRALREAGLADGIMLAMALATIRAESAGFVPVAEARSRYNTAPGGPPFGRYDDRTDLGNRGHPDGWTYRGRGFVQLTGRTNYVSFGRALGIPLAEEPDRANEPETAARLLALFLKSRETRIRAACARGDLAAARRAVNGGTHGLDRFAACYRAARALVS